MKLSDIADNAGSRKKRMRVGRGIGSGKGKTAGRGGKGQTARSGVRIKGFEGGQMPLHRRLPKRRFNNIFRLEFAEINLDRLQEAGRFQAGRRKETVAAESLVKAGVLRRSRDGVRLLGRGELKAKLNIEVHGASKPAIAAVEKAGGSVKILAPVGQGRRRSGVTSASSVVPAWPNCRTKRWTYRRGTPDNAARIIGLAGLDAGGGAAGESLKDGFSSRTTSGQHQFRRLRQGR